jgi:hypothetical protein
MRGGGPTAASAADPITLITFFDRNDPTVLGEYQSKIADLCGQLIPADPPDQERQTSSTTGASARPCYRDSNAGNSLSPRDFGRLLVMGTTTGCLPHLQSGCTRDWRQRRHPDIGIRGNSHMLMQDRNSLEIDSGSSRWLG